MWFLKYGSVGRDGGCNKKELVGWWNIQKSSVDHLIGGVNKWKQGKWVAIFPKNWYCPHPNAEYISEELSVDFKIFPSQLFSSLVHLDRK